MVGRQFFWRALVVCSLLSPVVLFSSNISPWKTGNYVGWLVQELITPPQVLWGSILSGLSSTWDSYFYLVAVNEENQLLKSEIDKLKLRMLDYDEKSDEIEQLRSLLRFARHYKHDHVVAEVVGHHTDSPFEVIKIGKGMMHGLEIGMPVITSDGVLGRVIRVRSYFSEVQILTDVNFHLDVLLQRTRSRGVLHGMFGNLCSLKLNRRAEVKIGDTLVTSGIIGGFPRGVPVGKVVKINYESDNITQVVTVEPWVDHLRTERVIVLKRVDEYMHRIQNAVGKTWLEKAVDTAGGGGAG